MYLYDANIFCAQIIFKEILKYKFVIMCMFNTPIYNFM